MHLTLSISDDVVERARRRALAMGMSLNQAVSAYLEALASQDLPGDAEEFQRLSRMTKGNRGNWQFDRSELHRRRLTSGFESV